jgi:hypothetical protein
MDVECRFVCRTCLLDILGVGITPVLTTDAGSCGALAPKGWM